MSPSSLAATTGSSRGLNESAHLSGVRTPLFRGALMVSRQGGRTGGALHYAHALAAGEEVERLLSFLISWSMTPGLIDKKPRGKSDPDNRTRSILCEAYAKRNIHRGPLRHRPSYTKDCGCRIQ